MANLYLISQTENGGYDRYDSAVVCAEDEEGARNTHPDGEWSDEEHGYMRTWCREPSQVSVSLIGTADPLIPLGVVLASFNAG